MVTWKLCIKKITQTISRKSVSCDIVVRKLCKYIFFWVYQRKNFFVSILQIFADIFCSKKKYKHFPAHFVRSQPQIIHLTPGATRTLVFYFISWKKGSNIIFNSSEFYLWLKGHSTHTSFQKIRGICLMKLTIKKFQNLPFFLNTKSQLGFLVFHFKQIWIFNRFGFSCSKNMANFEAFLKRTFHQA